ncbi:MAG TPA: tRNA (N6-threonylcarbamoyladenosine(37)-N6)-methyltransferase TrmO [Dehalococcoidia bacterium]|nr:tRNA (N6-threonylcarbamoyladenosine(37)-N6)-methyltransferase TrmO [Dehalococcoidia bacterium]
MRDPISLKPIGVVHTSVNDARAMPRGGLPATIEVYPEYALGLTQIEDNSHIVVVAWLHQAEQDVLKMERMLSYKEDEDNPGVFATRIPARPNPIGVSTARIEKVEGNTIHLACLDLIDGTPVLDIKPHSSGFDGVFASRSARDVKRLRFRDEAKELASLVREAENFHGEYCRGIALGARMVHHARVTFGIAQKDAELRVSLGDDGCIADALQGLSGATLGNGRLRLSMSPNFSLVYQDKRLRFLVKRVTPSTPEEVLKVDISALFTVQEGPA